MRAEYVIYSDEAFLFILSVRLSVSAPLVMTSCVLSVVGV